MRWPAGMEAASPGDGRRGPERPGIRGIWRLRHGIEEPGGAPDAVGGRVVPAAERSSSPPPAALDLNVAREP
jgi:hypothetical protein